MGHLCQLPVENVSDENGRPLTPQEYYAYRKKAANDEKWVWDRKEEAMKAHFNKILSADAILVFNRDKNNIPDYIGPNSLLEMGLAFHYGKKIYLLNAIPEMNYREEILAMKPIVLGGNLNLISS